MESLPELHLSPEDEKPEQLLQRKLHVRSRPPSKPTVVRGVTYYKAQSTESENDIEEQRELGLQPRPVGWLHPAAKPVSTPESCLMPWEAHGVTLGGGLGGGMIGTSPLCSL